MENVSFWHDSGHGMGPLVKIMSREKTEVRGVDLNACVGEVMDQGN